MSERKPFVTNTIQVYFAQIEDDYHFVFVKGSRAYIIPPADLFDLNVDMESPEAIEDLRGAFLYLPAYFGESFKSVEYNYPRYNSMQLFHEWYKYSIRRLAFIGSFNVTYNLNERISDESLDNDITTSIPRNRKTKEKHVYILNYPDNSKHMIVTQGKYFKYIEDSINNPKDYTDLPLDQLLSSLNGKRYIDDATFPMFKDLPFATHFIEELDLDILPRTFAQLYYLYTIDNE